MLFGLAGCGSEFFRNPVQWWHQREGGAIARQRPPPPNVDAPYPNLASVPAKPDMPDAAKRQQLTAALLADRANAHYAAKLAPLPTASQAASPFGPAAGAPQSAPDTNAASASLAAASTAPAASASPSPSAKPAEPQQLAALPQPMTSVGPFPAIPNAPPPPPNFAGIAIPPTKPTPPPVAPPEPPKSTTLSEKAAAPVMIGFTANSSVLSLPDVQALEGLAAKRGNHKIQVIGFGDAADATPEVQAEGMTLALSRARAMAAALTAKDVPAEAIRLGAEAAGRGGAARLID